MTRKLTQDEIKEREKFRKLSHNLMSALILEKFEKRYPSLDPNKIPTDDKKAFEQWAEKNFNRWRDTISAYKNGWNDAIKFYNKMLHRREQ